MEHKVLSYSRANKGTSCFFTVVLLFLISFFVFTPVSTLADDEQIGSSDSSATTTDIVTAATTAYTPDVTSDDGPAGIEPEPVIDILPIDIILNKSAISIIVKSTDTLTANVDVTWSSDSESIASIGTDSGIITAIATGTAIITATTKNGSNATTSATITVLPLPPLATPIISALGDHWQFSVPDARPSKYIHFFALSSDGTGISGATDEPFVDFFRTTTGEVLEIMESPGQIDGICTPVYTSDPLTDFACAINYAKENNIQYTIAFVRSTVLSAQIAAKALDTTTGTPNESIAIEDETPPLLTINGAELIHIPINTPFTDTGAVANDNIDGEDAVSIGGGAIDTSVAGTYHIVYDAVDTAGNHAIQKTRTIIVDNVAIPLTTEINPNDTTSAVFPEVTATSSPSEETKLTLTVNIPPDMTITGSSTWNGILELPTATTTYVLNASSGNTADMISAISIGAGETSLTFDRGVRLVFTGQANKLVGWSRNNSFTQITENCSGDSQSMGDALPDGSDCKINSDDGYDLIVWTKHFTTFVTYTETPIKQYAPRSGDGGVISGPNSFGYTATAPALKQKATTPKEMKALGSTAYKFDYMISYGNNNNEVAELQIFLTRAKLYSAKITGHFDTYTLNSVKALQKNNGITPTGAVGQRTLSLLNLGIIPTSTTTDSTTNNINAKLTDIEIQHFLSLIESLCADTKIITEISDLLYKR